MADDSEKHETVMTLVCVCGVVCGVCCAVLCVCVCAHLSSDCIKSIPSFRFDRNEFFVKWFCLYSDLYPHTPGSCKTQIP